MSENNVFQLSEKAPYGPVTAIQRILGFIERINGAAVERSHFIINGGYARFTWGGRTYSLVVQDIGPVNEEGA